MPSQIFGKIHYVYYRLLKSTFVIEIGTSDFDTLISTSKGRGISVEPIPGYFNNLPDKKDWYKLNVAISDKNGWLDMWYVDPNDITNEPDGVRGCNSVNRPHPTIQRDYPHLLTKTRVECITVKELYNRFNVTDVYFLKIDTEGHDTVILNNLLDNDLPLPKKIQFEHNVLTNDIEYRKVIKRLKYVGYTIKELANDTICKL